MYAVPKPDGLECRFSPLAHIGGVIAVAYRQGDIFEGVNAGQQVVVLEYKTDLLIPNDCELIIFQVGNKQRIEIIFTRSGRVEAADHVHQGRLARTARTHDGNHLTRKNLQVNAAQCWNHDLTKAIILGEITNIDHGHGCLGGQFHSYLPMPAKASISETGGESRMDSPSWMSA